MLFSIENNDPRVFSSSFFGVLRIRLRYKTSEIRDTSVHHRIVLVSVHRVRDVIGIREFSVAPVLVTIMNEFGSVAVFRAARDRPTKVGPLRVEIQYFPLVKCLAVPGWHCLQKKVFLRPVHTIWSSGCPRRTYWLFILAAKESKWQYGLLVRVVYSYKPLNERER